MPDSLALRLAVFTDLHVGATRAKHWHNQFLSDHPETTLSELVTRVNDDQPDIVVVCGDLSDTAADSELKGVRTVLDNLNAPCVVCRGNHDVTEDGGRAGFDRVFGDRTSVGVVEPSLLPLPDRISMVIFDAEWRTEGEQWRVFIPNDQLRSTLDALETARPELLLVACHFPFVRQSEFIRQQSPNADGKNAGTLWDGERMLEQIADRADYTLFLTGHQHFHHIVTGGSWLHCATAALVEYPAEYRLIDIRDGQLTITTHAGAPDLVAANPPDLTWVAGRKQDRQMTVDIGSGARLRPS